MRNEFWATAGELAVTASGAVSIVRFLYPSPTSDEEASILDEFRLADTNPPLGGILIFKGSRLEGLLRDKNITSWKDPASPKPPSDLRPSGLPTPVDLDIIQE